jgi:hypothetical protein
MQRRGLDGAASNHTGSVGAGVGEVKSEERKTLRKSNITGLLNLPTLPVNRGLVGSAALPNLEMNGNRKW